MELPQVTHVTSGHVALVDWARAEQKKVIPLCPFAKSVFEKAPEFQDVLK